MAPGFCYNIGTLSYTSSTRDDACSLLTGSIYYSDYLVPVVGSVFCMDSGCTTTAPQGFYSDSPSSGTNCYEVDSSGFVISISVCYATPTPTPTYTPTITPTRPFAVQFQSCEDGSEVFRYRGSLVPTNLGSTYFIENSKEFTGCATIVPYSGTGMLYDSDGVTFTSVFDCADGLCPRANRLSAVLVDCVTGDINYFTVDEDTAFTGVTYVYNNKCYSFSIFGGPGGPYIGSPSFINCYSCNIPPSPSVTPTFPITPSNTPTASPCNSSGFCLRTNSTTLSGYSGYYTSTLSTYNSRLYYTGDGVTYGVIYHTGTKWCLSNTLGGNCLLFGKSFCYSSCPDLSNNVFSNGVCPTPTPSSSGCTIVEFEAYFDCEYTPPVTPTPSIDCNDVNFILNSTPGIPTPTPTPEYITGVDFNVFIMSQTPTSSITPTPTPTPQPRIQLNGSANFNFVDQQFQNSLTRVIIDCNTGQEYYVGNQLFTGTTSLNIGTVISMSINTPQGTQNICATYDRISTTISPNSYINQIYGIFGYCGDCTT